jgi:hypothetical protein
MARDTCTATFSCLGSILIENANFLCCDTEVFCAISVEAPLYIDHESNRENFDMLVFNFR